MNDASINRFGDKAAEMAMSAAAAYIRKHGLTDIDLDAVIESLKTHVKAAMGTALDDAKEAFEAGMVQIAEHTFMASMAQAGIDAVKAVA